MSKETFVDGLRSNWYLLLFFLICSVAATMGAVRETNAPKPVVASAAVKTTSEIPLQDGYVHSSKWRKPTAVSKVEDAITEYEEAIATDRDGEETAANLFRLANLYYSKKLDYENAALYYEALLREFPDYMGIKSAYPNLAMCYERQGKLGLEINTYRRMMDHFSEDTQDHQWAKAQLSM